MNTYPRIRSIEALPAIRPRTIGVLVTAVAGLAAVGAGAALPWITLFRGLTPVPGFLLDGGFLSGLAVGAAALLLVAATQGGGVILRGLCVVTALVVAADAALVAGRIGAFVADPGAAGALSQPAAGMGAPVMAVGGGLLVVAAVITPFPRRTLARAVRTRLLLAGALFVAGWIHLMLAPAHLGESTVLGGGFLAAALAEIGLAALFVWRPRTWTAPVTAVVLVSLLVTYAYAVVVGLPFGDHAHEFGLVLGAGEPVDLLGGVCKLAEVVALGMVFTET